MVNYASQALMMQGMRGYENSSGWSGIKRRFHANARVGRRRVSSISDELRVCPFFVLNFYTFLKLFLFVPETFEGGVDRETPNQLRKNWNLGSNFNDFTRFHPTEGEFRKGASTGGAREEHGSTEGEGKNMRFHDFSDWSKIEILNQIQNNLIAKQSYHSLDDGQMGIAFVQLAEFMIG